MKNLHPENFISKHFHISLPNQILIAAVLGVIVGLFIGDLARIFMSVSNIYTMLLEVAVYPYIISSLLSSLGKLSPKLSFKLFQKGWWIYLLLILLTFATLWILTRAFPIATTTLKPTVPAETTGTQLLTLIIPDNLFEALSNNYVPAVVLFCILFGIMLQRVKGENVLFKILDTISNACIEFWNWLIKFVPLGVFASFTYISGTIHATQLKDVVEYLFLFGFGAIILTFWLLPNIISSFTDIRYRTLMEEMRNALIIAAATTVSILALPYMQKMIQKMLSKRKIRHSDAHDLTETTLLISYPFGQLGNFFIYLFILFATTYYNHPLTRLENWLLPVASYLSSIGSPNTTESAVAFLAGWLQMPKDIYNLYDSLSLITDYIQVLISVMGFTFLTILIVFSCYGLTKIRWHKFVTHLLLVAVVLLVFIHFFKNWVPNPGIKTYQRIVSATINPKITQGVTVTMQPAFDESKVAPVKTPEDTLLRVQRTGVLRVGYYPNARPFSYFNPQGQLVGFDVVHMYMLAKALNARLEFIPFNWPNLLNDLEGNKFDIAIGGIWASNERIQRADVSQPYIKNPSSLLVPKDKENNFSSVSRMQSLKNLRLGLYADPGVVQAVKDTLPNAQLIFVNNDDNITQAFKQNQVDTVLLQQIDGSIYALGHPGYVDIETPGIVAPFLVAYIVQNNSPQFLGFLNYWLDLMKNQGFTQEMYNRWILGRPIEFNVHRWSVWRNVLHK